MSNDFFRFKAFEIRQGQCAMKVCTDACILGAFAAHKIEISERQVGNILDIGGGTGLLSLMLAQKSTAGIDAIEIDKNAALQMSHNFRNSPWSERLHVHHGDVRQMRQEQQYDWIISNPPFFENQLKSGQENTTLAWHDTGLKMSELIPIIRDCLSPIGQYCILVPFFRLNQVISLLQNNHLSISEILHVRHSKRHPLFRSILTGSFITISDKPAPATITRELIISDNGVYTDSFKTLLKDYYLDL